MYQSISGHWGPPMGWTQLDWRDTLLPALTDAFHWGRLEARELARPSFVARVELPVADLAREAAPEAKDDFTLVLTNWLSGAPLANVSLTVRTSAGTEVRAKTDVDGRLRVPSLPMGSCEVVSVIAAARVESSYAIKGQARAVADQSENQGGSSSSSPQFLVRPTEYHVATGDTPESIAKAASVPWAQIASFNWGTADPAELEERYREELGCRHMSDDGRGYRFDDADDPGILLIPRPWQATLEVGRTHRLSAEPLRPLFVSLENEFALRLPGAAFRL